MKILWMCNGSLPAIAEMQNKTTAVCLGGWLEGLSKNLLRNPDIQLIYCYSDYEISCVQTGARDNLKYYAIPMTRKEANESMPNTSVAYKTFSDILRESQPDIIHFFGTEFVYTDVFLDICIDCGFGDKVVVSIQGLVSKYFLHFDADLPAHVIWSKTLNELKGHASLRNIKKSFRQRGNHECVALKKAKHIIGRTSWDRAVTELIAPETQYHFCNETLRDEFYTGQWNPNACNRYQIAISQSSYPIKGLHKVVEAVAMIADIFPQIQVVVGGIDVFHGNCIRGNTYGNYVRKLIRKYELDDHFKFVGMVNASEMKKLMLESNVFVCPSAIENSPNSLGEAMLLGVPCIASDVGGVQDMMTRDIEGYVYPFNETYKLAYYLKKVFEGNEQILDMAQAGRRKALITHDPETNNQRLVEIYQEIGGEGVIE